MPSKKRSSRMTKAQFIQRISSGTLSADAVTAELADELHEYENKYKMRSEVFFALIAGTPAEDTPDLLNWAMCYRSYFRALQAKLPVKELSHFAQ